MAKRMIYYPPSRKTIDEFAKRVSERLGKARDVSYNHPDVVWGLARFVELAAKMLAKQLTKESEETGENLDSDGN